jgi:NAD(P)-dependent dehydrogenase (short-subunit alcohol dehydrogenase family)
VNSITYCLSCITTGSAKLVTFTLNRFVQKLQSKTNKTTKRSPWCTGFKAGGTGLGLSITIGIPKANHASIDIQSQEGKRFRQIYSSSKTHEMEHYFKGKTVLVTGAGWGIGAAAALLYAAYGAKVIISDTSRKGGKDTLEKIKNQRGNATYIKTDVSNAAACEELIKRTIRTYGSIDIACNNSAVFSEPLHSADRDMESADNQVGLNLTGLNNCMQYEIEAMQKQGGGVIVNTSSIMGAGSLASSIKYIEAKYGILTLLQNVSGEYPAIHINTIAPAFIDTAVLKDMIQKETEGGIKLFPMDRHGTVQEVAGLVLWLSSDETHLLPTVCNDNN